MDSYADKLAYVYYLLNNAHLDVFAPFLIFETICDIS